MWQLNTDFVQTKLTLTATTLLQHFEFFGLKFTQKSVMSSVLAFLFFLCRSPTFRSNNMVSSQVGEKFKPFQNKKLLKKLQKAS